MRGNALLAALVALVLVVAWGWWRSDRAVERWRREAEHALLTSDSVTARLRATEEVLIERARERAASETLRARARVRIDTALIEVKRAVPDTLIPIVQKLSDALVEERKRADELELLWAEEARLLRGSLAEAELDRERLRAALEAGLRAARPRRFACLVGAALTTDGVEPAISCGLRLPWP